MRESRAERRKREARKRVLLLVAADAATIVAAFLAAYWFRLLSGFFATYIPIQSLHLYALVGVAGLWIVIFGIHGLYRREVYLSVFDQMVGIFNSVNIGVLVILATAFATKTNYFLERRLVLVLAWALSILLLSVVRIGVVRVRILRNQKRDPFRCRVLVVGAGEMGTQFVKLARLTMDHVYEVVGFVDDDPAKKGSRVEDIPVLGSTAEIERLTEENEVERIFLAVRGLREEQVIDLYSRCMRAKVPVKMVSDQFQLISSAATLERVDGVPTLGVRENSMRGIAYGAKRASDVLISSVLLILLLPLFGMIAFLVKAFSPGPIFFRQTRAGRNGAPFEFFKFRTMRTGTDDRIHREYATNFISGKDPESGTDESEKPVYKMKRDPRVTKVGLVLRKTSLDELPQLYNVLRGEMSLVGPRPPIVYELQHYKEWHMRRLEAKPGLTGLWQVSGRSEVPFNEMVLLDLYYIDHWSLKLDLEILLRTVPVILFGKGAY
ncbi:MAG: sugar transferase [Candidatus Latescibacterota bacterium]|nr:MAG: sugar transferase [Candidatus Latescibacterota bacterium]